MLAVTATALLLASSLTVTGATGAKGARATPPKATRPEPSQLSLDALGKEFRRLQAIDRRSRQTPQEEDDTSQWGGRMQMVMNELQRRLGRVGTEQRRLIEIMGEPHERLAPGQTNFWCQGHAGSATTVFIYYWSEHRGDLLYFELLDGKVTRSDWWMPLE